MATATQNLEIIQERIAKAAQRAGRDPKSVTLLAVTKTVPLDRVLPYLQAGIRHVAENRLQEALDKYSVKREGWREQPKFHLIGPLQSNKAKKAVEFFDLIQTLDRWSLAEDLHRHAAGVGKIQDCLIQIKISDEITKSGLDPSALPEFLEKLKACPHIAVRGLMGIPPLDATGEASRPYFQKLRRLCEGLPDASRSPLHVLSMGMSSDFEVAIEEGSTMVRIGTALFGNRTSQIVK